MKYFWSHFLIILISFRVVELDKKKTTQLKDRGNVKADSDTSEDSSDEEFAPVIWRTKNSLI